MSRPGRVNRFWLIVLGLLLLLAGLAGLGIGTGLLQPLLDRVAAGVQLPDRADPVFGGFDFTQFTRPGPQTIMVGVIGALIVLIGLAWIIRQLPRRPRISDYRLHDDARTGLVTVHPKVIAEALADRVGELPGVIAAVVRLSGTADQPAVRMTITADARADLPEVVRSARDRVAEDLAISLEARLSRCAIQLDISPHQAVQGEVVL